MDYAPTDFATVARGFDCMGIRVEVPGELPGALQEAFSSERPIVVDVAVDRHAYHPMPRALRG
jgi:thiamine pyrophosphate-dependent acetolactate synthase large subunit-like protein